MSQDYANKLNQNVDRAVTEKCNKPAETITLVDVGLHSQKEIEDLSEITLGNIAPETQP